MELYEKCEAKLGKTRKEWFRYTTHEIEHYQVQSIIITLDSSTLPAVYFIHHFLYPYPTPQLLSHYFTIVRMSKEASPETNIVTATPRRPRSIEDDESGHSLDVKAMDVVEMSETESEESKENEDKPSQGEVISWCFYELCSYFTHTVLLTIVFPLIISQTFSKEPPEPARGWYENRNGFHCTKKETVL